MQPIEAVCPVGGEVMVVRFLNEDGTPAPSFCVEHDVRSIVLGPENDAV